MCWLAVARYDNCRAMAGSSLVLGRWGVPPVPVVTTLAWSNYAHTRIAILILSNVALSLTLCLTAGVNDIS